MKPLLWLLTGLLLGIAGSWLFGRLQAPQEPDALPTSVAEPPAPPLAPLVAPAPGYRLHGSYVDERPERSLAWIGLADSPAYRAYHIGEVLPGGARLDEVAANRVRLSAADGSAIELGLRGSTDTAPAAAAQAPPANPQEAFARMRERHTFGDGGRRSGGLHQRQRQAEPRGPTALEPAPKESVEEAVEGLDAGE